MGRNLGNLEGDRQPEPKIALAWAEIAGLVEIMPDGRWHLTALGTLRMRELQALDPHSGVGRDPQLDANDHVPRDGASSKDHS
jgi:hypothetical protein